MRFCRFLMVFCLLLLVPSAGYADDSFGRDIVLSSRPGLVLSGQGQWENALDIIISSFKRLYTYADTQKLERDGFPLMVYTQSDDREFSFQAVLPLKSLPSVQPPAGLSFLTIPGGKAYQFAHKGSFETIETTYEAITHLMDERRVTLQDLMIEEYIADPVSVSEDKMNLNIYVFPK